MDITYLYMKTFIVVSEDIVDSISMCKVNARLINSFLASSNFFLSFFLSFLYYWHDQILIITPGSAILGILKKKKKKNSFGCVFN